MHKEFNKLLDDASGDSHHVVAIVLDIRGFTPFCEREDALNVATYITRVYKKVINDYFPDASFYKPTGDGLLLVLKYDRKNLEAVAHKAVASCLKLLDEFPSLCVDDRMVNFETPYNIGIGIARGSACCIIAGKKILDYSGKLLNLTSRLMDMARPSGIVLDSGFGLDLLPKEISELFSEDNVYVRGIAELEPRAIFYTTKRTLIPDVFKRPIREPRWHTDSMKTTLRDLKELDIRGVLSLGLTHEPIDVEKIQVEIIYEQTLKTGKSFTVTLANPLSRAKGCEHQKRGKKHEIWFRIEPTLETIKAQADEIFDKDDTEFTFSAIYPIVEP